MNNEEALKEAQRRWGANGMCWDHTGSKCVEPACLAVGVVDGLSNYLSDASTAARVLGHGATWEEAFEAASVVRQWVREGMNADHARREAFDRWGFRGVCRDRGDDHHPLVGQYMVGVEHQASGAILVRGEGPTWEEAFHDADGRVDFMNFMADRPKDSAVVVRLNPKVLRSVVDETTADTDRILAANHAKQGCPCGCGASKIEECWNGSIAARCCICNAYPCYQMIGQDPWCVRCAER